VQPVEKKSRTADVETISMSAIAADIIKSINYETIVPAGSTKDTIAAVYHRLDGDEESLVSDGLIDALEADEEAQRLEITLLNLDARRVQERQRDKEEEYKVSRAVAEAEARAAAIKAQLKKAKTPTPSVASTLDYDDQPLNLSNDTDKLDGKPGPSETGVSGPTTEQVHEISSSSGVRAADDIVVGASPQASPKSPHETGNVDGNSSSCCSINQGAEFRPQGRSRASHDEPPSGISLKGLLDGRRVSKLVGPGGTAQNADKLSCRLE